MMEENIFPRPAVADLLTNDYVEARMHNDHLDEAINLANRKLMWKYSGTFSAPTYVIIDPATRKMIGKKHVLQGATNGFDYLEKRFLKFLRRH